MNLLLKISSSVKAYLISQSPLADLYNPDMEVQINVAQDGSELMQGEGEGKRFRKYSDGVQTWFPIRIPKHANTEPEDNDGPITYDLAVHAEGIGLTGWDWRHKLSRYVAFDFDSISNHVRNGLTDAQIQEVKEQAKQIPWITVRKSTSGKGLHLYVALAELKSPGVWDGGVPTRNHNEHAALARSILGMMASYTDFDFSGKMDVCGGNMWVWHRKMIGTDGFTLIKQGEILRDVPANWRDHLEVVRGERKRTRPKFVEDGRGDEFDELTGTHLRVSLGESHKALIRWLEENKALSWWDPDRHLLVAHTFDLKAAHEALGLIGIFETKSTGKEHGNDQNCFMFPIAGGGWVVRRHTPGVCEATSWDQDGKGWTRCFFNVPPDLPTAARIHDGVEHPKGGYVFPDVASARDALLKLGLHVNIPDGILDRPGPVLKPKPDGRLIFEIRRESHDEASKLKDWVGEPKKWLRVVTPKTRAVTEESTDYQADRFVRHIIDVNNEDSGWVIKNANADWQMECIQHVRAVLDSYNIPTKEATKLLGTSIVQSWKLVNKPFQPEYPGNREWNKDSAQLRFTPSVGEDLKFEHWKKVFSQCGRGLDVAVKTNPWCVANSVTTGGEYLQYWVASLFQAPEKNLPYLFFWSKKQGTGKSTFHEALSLLMTRGFIDAAAALTNESGFNGELAAAVLCVIEEMAIAKSKLAYPRMKNWITARNISIHAKGGTPYLTRNYTHWIHCANDRDSCPVLPDDTRITMIQVPELDLIEMIPKHELITHLENEAPDFLRFLLDVEIPKAVDRLNVPMIETYEKKTLAGRNKEILDQFIDENCYRSNGYRIRFADFYDRFEAYILDPAEQGQWSKKRVSKHLPLECPVNRLSNDPSYWIGNLSWKVDEKGEMISEPAVRHTRWIQVPDDNKIVEEVC